MEPSLQKTVENVDIDTSLPKLAAIGALGVIFALGFGYLLSNYLSLDNLQNLLYSTLFLIGFLSIFILQTFFIKSKNLSALIIFLESFAATLPFIFNFSLSLLLAFSSLFLFLWLANLRGRNELGNQIKVQFFRVEHMVSPRALTAFSLFISLIYLGSFNFNGQLISKDKFNSLFLNPTEPLMQRFYNEKFSFGMKISSFVELLAVQQLGVQATLLTSQEKNLMVGETLNQLRISAAGYGVSFKNSDTLADIFYNYANQKINLIPENFKNILPIGLVLILFLTIKGIAVFLRWFIALVAYLLYKLALITNFARLSLESRSREIVLLK